jgi:hypothetical protein
MDVKVDVYAMFKIYYGLNKIHPTLYSDQMKSFIGKTLVSILEV